LVLLYFYREVVSYVVFSLSLERGGHLSRFYCNLIEVVA
jgi:hypothetical protein